MKKTMAHLTVQTTMGQCLNFEATPEQIKAFDTTIGKLGGFPVQVMYIVPDSAALIQAKQAWDSISQMQVMIVCPGEAPYELQIAIADRESFNELLKKKYGVKDNGNMTTDGKKIVYMLTDAYLFKKLKEDLNPVSGN